MYNYGPILVQRFDGKNWIHGLHVRTWLYTWPLKDLPIKQEHQTISFPDWSHPQEDKWILIIIWTLWGANRQIFGTGCFRSTVDKWATPQCMHILCKSAHTGMHTAKSGHFCSNLRLLPIPERNMEQTPMEKNSHCNFISQTILLMSSIYWRSCHCVFHNHLQIDMQNSFHYSCNNRATHSSKSNKSRNLEKNLED